jgi:hypothetical protein
LQSLVENPVEGDRGAITAKAMQRPHRFFKFCILVASITIAADIAHAQTGGRKTLLQWSYGTSFEGGPNLDEPIVTDRPDFTESSVTVGDGVTQVEMGYTYTYDQDAASSTSQHSYPETLFRIGMLADWFEFRLDWNVGGVNENAFDAGDISDVGSEDMGVGCKIALTPQECILPETAIILESSIPTGDQEFTAGEMLPGFSYLYGWTINDQWETGALTGLHREADEETGDFYMQFAQSWTLVRSWTEDISSYGEWYCFVPTGADTDPTQHYFNGGFSVLLSDDVQWDIRAGVGLNDAADDYFVGSGLSVRFK